MHGIRKYEKPVITIDTLFDAFLRAGKKCALVGFKKASVMNIFKERDMDYYIVDREESDAANAIAARLIIEDQYDLIVVYNGNYDTLMHKHGPESIEALSEARCNSEDFATFCTLIQEHWKNHNTLAAFAMDHGCHEIDGGCGSHGLDMVEDLNICHTYRFFEREEGSLSGQGN